MSKAYYEMTVEEKMQVANEVSDKIRLCLPEGVSVRRIEQIRGYAVCSSVKTLVLNIEPSFSLVSLSLVNKLRDRLYHEHAVHVEEILLFVRGDQE